MQAVWCTHPHPPKPHRAAIRFAPGLLLTVCNRKKKAAALLAVRGRMRRHMTGSGRCPAIQTDINGFLFLLSLATPPPPPHQNHCAPANIFPSALPSFVLPLFFSLSLPPVSPSRVPRPPCLASSDLPFLRLLTRTRARAHARAPTHTSVGFPPHVCWTLHMQRTKANPPASLAELKVISSFLLAGELTGGRGAHRRSRALANLMRPKA